MINEVFNTFIQFLAENFGNEVAMTVGNGIAFSVIGAIGLIFAILGI